MSLKRRIKPRKLNEKVLTNPKLNDFLRLKVEKQNVIISAVIV